MSRVALLALVLGAPAAAQDLSPCLGLELGAPLSAVQARLPGARRLQADQPQALAQGLVQSGLLEVLNHLHAAPVERDSGALDARAFTQLLLWERGGLRCVMAFGGGAAPGLTLVMTGVSVPIDGGSDSPERLHRLREALKEAGRSVAALHPRERDVYGNVFVWEGEQRGRTLRAWYVPERDQLYCLLSRR